MGLDLPEAGLREVLPRELLAPHSAETVSTLSEPDGHAVEARDRVEERADRVVEVLVHPARGADVLHQVEAVRLERPVNSPQDLEGPALVVYGVEGRDQVEGV